MCNIQGVIFEIQRFCINDGPGIRTTVFLKGCPLHCIWCHNPEGQSGRPIISLLTSKCIGCGYCLHACPRQLHSVDNGERIFDRSRCLACGVCAAECYSGALELIGCTKSVEEIMEDVLQDRPFYETSSGGLTLSGGEPLAQVDFSAALLKRAKKEGLHCALETCGHVPWEHFERVAEHVDLFLYDVKETDPARHREYTGFGNELILSNLRRLHDLGAKIRLRCPIIPDFNDRNDHFETLGQLCKELPNLEAIEIMPYHPLGTSKNERFGFLSQNNLPASSTSREEVEEWIEALRSMGARLPVS